MSAQPRLVELSPMKVVHTAVEVGQDEFRYSAKVQPAQFTVLEPVVMVPGQPQREERAERARRLLDVAEKTRITGMRVPVYFTELAVAVRLALYGMGDALGQMMARNNEHMARCGVKGDIESLQ